MQHRVTFQASTSWSFHLIKIGHEFLNNPKSELQPDIRVQATC